MGTTHGRGLVPGTFAADFYWKSLERPRRRHSYLLYRDGWLRVTQAERPLSSGRHRHILLTCIDGYGNRIPQWIAEGLLEMQLSMPYVPDEPQPIETLDKVEDSLVLGFLVESDRELERAIQQRRDDAERAIRQLDAQYQDGVRLLAEKRRSLLRLRLAGGERTVLKDFEARLDRLHDQLDLAFQAEVRRIRLATREAENRLFEELELDPELDNFYTVRWRVVL